MSPIGVIMGVAMETGVLPYGLKRCGVVVPERGALPGADELEVEGSEEVEEDDGDGAWVFLT